MGLRIPCLILASLLAGGADAFVPHALKSSASTLTSTPPAVSKSARYFGVDPNLFHDLTHQTQPFFDNAAAFSSISLADAVDAASDAVNEVVTKDNGWFGFLTEPIELLLQLIHSGLTAVGISENSWGVSIVAMTVLIKGLTFPLTKTQLESTNKMQVRLHLD